MEQQQKSEKAYHSISEVSELLGVPAHVLRFWETKFHEIAPLKRGGRRRYYTLNDVEVLKRVKILLHEKNFKIAGVQKLFKEKDPLQIDLASFSPNPRKFSDAALVKEMKEMKALLDQALQD